MTNTRTNIALLLTAVSVLGPPLAPTSVAQTRSCARIAEQFDRETRAFVDEANRQNLGFLRGEALTGASGSLKTLMSGSPSASTALELKEKWDEVQAARERIQSTAQVWREIVACLNTAGCNPMDIANRAAADVRAWAEATLKANASAASARVEQARALLQNYANRSLNLSLGTMKSMADCTTQFTEQAQANSPATPVPVPPAATKGGGAGKALVAIVGGAVAIGGGLYAYNTYQESQAILDELNTTVGGTTAGGVTTPPAATGVRRFDGVYDFAVVVPNFAGDSTIRSPAGLSINNGVVTTTNRDLSGTVNDAGTFTGVGACTVNNGSADFTGTISTNGTGSGTYRCRIEGISRGWSVSNRR